MRETIRNYTISNQLYRDESFIYYVSENKNGESIIIAEFMPVESNNSDYAALAAEKQKCISALSAYILNADFLRPAEDFFFEDRLFIVSCPADTYTIRERLSGGVYRPEHVFKLVLPFIKALDKICKSSLSYTHISPDNTAITNGRLSLLQFGKTGPSKAINSIRAVAELTYYLLTGREYCEAMTAPSLLGITLAPSVEAVLLRALTEDEHTNFRTLFELHESLAEKIKAPSALVKLPAPENELKTGRLALAVGGAILIALVLIIVLAWAIIGLVGNLSFSREPEPEPEHVIETEIADYYESPDDYRYYTSIMVDSYDDGIILNGIAAENSAYVYYRIWTDESFGIMRQHKIFGTRELIADYVLPSFILASDSKLFYNDAFQGYGLVMSDIDGSNSKLIISDTCLYPVFNENENAIYYSKYGYGEIIRYSTDDRSFRVVADYSASELFIHNNYLYFINMQDSFLYRMKLDGSDAELWLEEPLFRIVRHENELYYISSNDNSLYSIALADNNTSKLISPEPIYHFAINGDDIYFISEEREYALYNRNPDTNDTKMLYDDDLSYLMIINNQIYYISDLENGVLIRCDFDGDRREIIGY